MGLRFPDQKNHSCFFVTTTFSGHASLASAEGVYQILIDSLQFYSRKYEARLAAYVLMPSHLHLLLFIDGSCLADFMRDFKKFTAHRVMNNISDRISNLWMPRYDRVAIGGERVFRIKLDYIHNNPVKSGLVQNPEDWPWSSAGAYIKGIDIFKLVWKEW
ncbi:conserved hypothetical protein [Candidatus Zixiibacteriota bacterium]|nr:conserved hypothetical protein [candidate division Zixibacteria bacterium]